MSLMKLVYDLLPFCFMREMDAAPLKLLSDSCWHEFHDLWSCNDMQHLLGGRTNMCIQ